MNSENRSENRRAMPHTSERPVYNPYSPSKKVLNPNWRWKQDNVLAMGSRPKDLKEVTDLAETNKNALSALHKVVGGLILVYENEHINYASCFRVGKGIWATARHNLENELQTDSTLYRIFITLDRTLPHQARGIEVVLDDLTEGGYFEVEYPCKDLELEQISRDLMKDDTDPTSGKIWETQANFAFLKAEKDESEDFMLPFGGSFTEKDAVAVAGFNMPVTEKYIMDTFGADEITVRGLSDHFNGFNRKTLSPGQLLAPISTETCFNVPLLPHSCSTLPGSSGSVGVWMKDPSYFIAIHVGSWSKVSFEKNNYNLMFSIHHPVFVLEYFSKIFPHLSAEMKAKIKPYIERHSVLLREKFNNLSV